MMTAVQGTEGWHLPRHLRIFEAIHTELGWPVFGLEDAGIVARAAPYQSIDELIRS